MGQVYIYYENYLPKIMKRYAYAMSTTSTASRYLSHICFSGLKSQSPIRNRGRIVISKASNIKNFNAIFIISFVICLWYVKGLARAIHRSIAMTTAIQPELKPKKRHITQPAQLYVAIGGSLVFSARYHFKRCCVNNPRIPIRLFVKRYL